MAESWRFEVLDQGNVIGEITPQRAPSIQHTATGAIGRTLSGVTLDPTDTAAIDRYSDRVRPVRVDGATETPLGVFLWAADSTATKPWGDVIEGGALYDQGLILGYGLSETTAFDVGDVLTTLLTSLVDDAGITDHRITTSTRTLADPVGWAVGTARREPINHLLELLGYTAHFDGDGVFVAEPIKIPGLTAPDHWFDEGTDSVIVSGSPVMTTDLWRSPNVYLVSSSSANGATILGRFDLPPEHPASFANRGYRLVSEVHTIEGLESSAQADELARVDARKAAAAIETVTFVTGPRIHGHLNVVSWMGDERWQESAWSLTCDVGGLMSHTIDKVVI